MAHVRIGHHAKKPCGVLHLCRTASTIRKDSKSDAAKFIELGHASTFGLVTMFLLTNKKLTRFRWYMELVARHGGIFFCSANFYVRLNTEVGTRSDGSQSPASHVPHALLLFIPERGLHALTFIKFFFFSNKDGAWDSILILSTWYILEVLRMFLDFLTSHD